MSALQVFAALATALLSSQGSRGSVAIAMLDYEVGRSEFVCRSNTSGRDEFLLEFSGSEKVMNFVVRPLDEMVWPRKDVELSHKVYLIQKVYPDWRTADKLDLVYSTSFGPAHAKHVDEGNSYDIGFSLPMKTYADGTMAEVGTANLKIYPGPDGLAQGREPVFVGTCVETPPVTGQSGDDAADENTGETAQ